MKAVVVSKYGPPEGLELIDIEKPAPKAKELLVKINATTVTFGDAMLRRMGFASRLLLGLFMGGLGKNKILGHEYAGEIEAVGDEVTLFKPDDQIFGSAGMKGGAYTEYICIPEDSMLALKPENLSFEEAAAVPIGAHTAFDILRKGNIESDQEVLIYGASGSVGSYALQLAKYWGAEVTGVCSTSNLEWVKNLGADKVVDYTTEDFTQTGETYDNIFDAVRKISSSKSERALKENGVFLSVGSSTKEEAENLVFLRQLIEDGKLKPVTDRTYPLEEIVEAHRYVDKGHKKGNVVITLDHL
ncbi:MAG: NADPH:quinone oxidoreductase [Candidatus Thorarchaeota archaeon SMTZ-45]|nr:MAG: NADPH:quinone oxidoreductase [Candidatus Thorarchaeota archaeon SMTZ-45]